MNRNSVKFDPGFAPHVLGFSNNIYQIETMLSSSLPFKQKRMIYVKNIAQIKKVFDNTAGFYAACIFWGALIEFQNRKNPSHIDGNPMISQDENDLMLKEIEYAKNYLKKFESDCKYYASKPSGIAGFYEEIFNEYHKFVSENNNFINCKTTSDLKIGEKFSGYIEKNEQKIAAAIESAVNNGDFQPVLEYFRQLFN